MNQIHQIKLFHETKLPLPTEVDAHHQIRAHVNSFETLLRTLTDAGQTFSGREQLSFIADVLDFTQRQFQSGNIIIALEDVDRTAILETLCAQITTAIGLAHTLGMDIEGALHLVSESNPTVPDLRPYAERTLL